MTATNTIKTVLLLGLLSAMLLFAGEAIADQQMAGFKRAPANRGRICDQGLWAWSRHPNYFFEWLGWLAYPIMAIEAAYPAGWLTLSGPLVIYWLLVHVSGVPPLEAHLSRSRPAEFAAYAENVSVFWPRPPRNRPSTPEATTPEPGSAGREQPPRSRLAPGLFQSGVARVIGAADRAPPEVESEPKRPDRGHRADQGRS